MLTEFIRDHAFSIAWFGLMTMVWLGWAQEDPEPSNRWKLGAGSILGLGFAGIFGFTVFLHWRDGSALDGNWHLYGILVGSEVLLAAAGAIALAFRELSRWTAWWIALVVAVHFIPMALLLQDLSMAILGLIQTLGLFVLLLRLRTDEHATSRRVGPFMGISLLVFAVISAAVFVLRVGSPSVHHGG
ncbi:hypothetical protein [Gulosibacter molinativorax]|uniref:Uncharacterized protein n=1 Tax=Gulosibacter molinativorax TaxID=256821 RepID=A0ABT7C6F6_9MICO|nr:hypothetical protein [Gulosibacter molinativorax]MDJ1370791.1 hypothetical protein [Gulosibacter molinativorax]QUY62127.1 Putative membrane protein [Gulosibacter molinativorax]